MTRNALLGFTCLLALAVACGGEDTGALSRDRIDGEALLGSCEPMSCGGPSFDGNCWCDEPCDAFGDCCTNRREACGLRLATYNTGLAHGAVTFATERRPLIVDALRTTEADVLCLQEVWRDEDAAAITSALAETHPHSFREVTEDSSWSLLPRCAPWSVLSLQSCVDDCEAAGISVFECIADPCKDKYDSLSTGCKLCLAANTTSPTSCATFGAKDFANAGRNGLLLLSRRPIENPRYTPFDTLLIKRGMITANVGDLHVQCTHMTSDLQDVPYPEDNNFSSWEEEHRGQIEALTEDAPADQCTVLMGDLNAGDRDAAAEPELLSNYRQFLEAGYEEPWEGPRCTFCQENPLASTKVDVRIDHILFKGCERRSHYERIMDGSIQLEVEGRTYMTRLSDHYGIRALLEAP